MSNISTAMAIQGACKDSVFDHDTMSIAAEIAREVNFNDKVLSLLLKYSASLSGDVAARVTHILMPKDELLSMVNDLQEMESWNVN